MNTPGVALVVTSAAAESLDPRLRAPDLVDRELPLPAPGGPRPRPSCWPAAARGAAGRRTSTCARSPRRTPGFVAADLVAVRREAAVRAARCVARGTGEDDADRCEHATICSTRSARSGRLDVLVGDPETGGITLDHVGDMTETKQALTEAGCGRCGTRTPSPGSAWPPRGVLLYGPPGCGKTFLVRALAGTGAAQRVRGQGRRAAGQVRRRVRAGGARAVPPGRGRRPALVFLDEVDALAPRRGRSTDAGVADRVVAALLTELDGAEPLRDVVVIGATNRPELIDPALLRPGRLERLVYVPPPDAAARAEILRAAARNTPLADDVDLAALARAGRLLGGRLRRADARGGADGDARVVGRPPRSRRRTWRPPARPCCRRWTRRSWPRCEAYAERRSGRSASGSRW